MTTAIKFETGNVYEMRFITDSELKAEFICTKLTKTMATFERYGNPSDSITKKIKTNPEGIEYVVTDSYSLAPVIKANRITR